MGIGRGINRRELLQIAMSDSQYVIQVQDFNSLKQKLQMILDDSCQGNVAGITPRVFQISARHEKRGQKSRVRDMWRTRAAVGSPIRRRACILPTLYSRLLACDVIYVLLPSTQGEHICLLFSEFLLLILLRVFCIVLVEAPLEGS